MCFRYSSKRVGKRLSSHVIAFTLIGAPAGASFISAIRTSVVFLLSCAVCGQAGPDEGARAGHQAFLSAWPISSLRSVRYTCGGTSRLSGAGLFLNTRPARSKVEPWHGHRKPPAQSSGSEGCGPGVNLSLGEQPRCEQMPTATKYSFLIERHSFLA